jgi:hypothetical protein
MSDDTRQARIEAAIKAYDEVYCTFWPVMGIRERVRLRGIAAMSAAIDAADAVGRERVRDDEALIDPTDFDEMVDEFRDAVQFSLDNTGDEGATENEEEIRHYLKTYYRTAFAFTAAPPERHDAPGVSMSREDAEQVVDDYCGLENQRRPLITLLTGSPDAGRDPDAGEGE